MAIITVQEAKARIREGYKYNEIDKIEKADLLSAYQGHSDEELVNIDFDDCCYDYEPTFVKDERL